MEPKMVPYYEMKPNMQGTKTEANLLKHWRAKSVAKMKMTLYQYPVRNDMRHLASLLAEMATNSYIHAAHFHQALWGPYADVERNLSAMISREHEDAHHIFPAYAQTAREEGFEEIAQAFEAIAKVDAEQEKKYAEILYKLENGQIFAKDEEQDWYCKQCGYVHHGNEAPETCPLCKGPRRYFELKGANFCTF